MLFTSWLSERLRSTSRTRGMAARPASKRRARSSQRAFRPGLECLEDRCVPSTLAVTSALDDVSHHGTLRYAVANARDGDTILLTAAVARTGIALTQGELILNQHNLTIASAAPPMPVTISGGNHSRVFEVAGGASVTLANLTVTGGNGLTGNPTDPHEGRGGGVVVDEGAALTITDSTVTDNSAPRLGGGIADYGTLTLSGCTVSHNHALGTYGGGIGVFSGAPFSAPFSATLTVSGSTLSGNTALQNGGGITGVSSTVILNSCAVTGNSVLLFDGGGLNNHGGTLTVSHSQVAGNSAPKGFGGGVYNDVSSALTIIDCDLAGNFARTGGGIGNSGALTIRDSQLAGNTTSPFNLGGGIFNYYSGTVSMTHDLLTRNAAEVGGGIFSVGTVTMSNSQLSDNSARNSGGAVSNYGTLEVSHSVLSNNSAYYGGAIENGGTTTISDSKLDGNSATGQGGGIINFGMLTISGGEINNNTSTWGGGIDNEYGAVTLSECLLSGNSAAEDGGAIFNYDTLTIDGCTLSGNTASYGGGIANFWMLTVSNSTFIANAPDNIYGSYTDGGGNTGL
jgi:hypothetical protein